MTKKLSYKQINDYEFEIAVDGYCIGTIRGNIYGKWTLDPNFKLYKQDLSAYKILTNKYNDPYDAGKKLFELWDRAEEEFYRSYFDHNQDKKDEEHDLSLPDDLFKL
tara:strand:- start:578 stop:898 length:321 start_codon:yes stop_codon:yes gene_type:complete